MPPGRMSVTSLRSPVHPMTLPEPPDKLSRLCREKALRFAILLDAIRCLGGNPGVRSRDRMVLARRAEMWIRRRDWRWPFSFNNICEALDIDANRVRNHLLDPANGYMARTRSAPIAVVPDPVQVAEPVSKRNGRAAREAAPAARRGEPLERSQVARASGNGR
jgi:hypothetical protein